MFIKTRRQNDFCKNIFKWLVGRKERNNIKNIVLITN